MKSYNVYMSIEKITAGVCQPILTVMSLFQESWLLLFSFSNDLQYKELVYLEGFSRPVLRDVIYLE